jgi:hypothetical protein
LGHFRARYKNEETWKKPRQNVNSISLLPRVVCGASQRALLTYGFLKSLLGVELEKTHAFFFNLESVIE